jgi:diguanylate cyclase (GGDEF)-like protein
MIKEKENGMEKNIAKSVEINHIETLEERKNGLIVASVFIVVLLTILIGLYYYYHSINEEEYLNLQQTELDIMETSIQTNMEIAISPLLIFSRSEVVKQMLVANDELTRYVFNDIFISLAKEINVFQQIRLIDKIGMEIVRVDNNKGIIEAVPEGYLQNKSDRYYFANTLGAPADTIYISPFDLNIENGEIEIPYKPMIRLGKTYVNSDGEISGMLMLNILGQKLINDINSQNVHKNDKVYLINKNGYYLVSDDSDKNFSFMFTEKGNIGFFSDFQDVWQKIINGERIVETDYGNFYIRKIDLLNQQKYKTTESLFYLIMFAPADEVNPEDKKLINVLIISSIVLLPLVGIIGWNLGVIGKRNINYRNRLKENATHDNLTGLYNHRMIITLLNEMMGLSIRNNEDLAVVFIDVNNLKYVNDNYGHKMGDKMILGAADSITSAVRSTDMVARLGGDEFLVVLPKCDDANVHKIMERALVQFAEIGIEEMNTKWVFSYGCAINDKIETINELISRADKLMYENKLITKANNNF